jgi:hypothetical protein
MTISKTGNKLSNMTAVVLLLPLWKSRITLENSGLYKPSHLNFVFKFSKKNITGNTLFYNNLKSH